MTVIDADGHVTESQEQLARYLEEPYRRRPTTFPFHPWDGWDRRMLGTLGQWAGDAAAWLRALDEGGVATTVLYPTLGLFASFATADFLLRAREFPHVRLWRAMGIVSMLLYFAIVTYAPFLWDGWLAGHQLVDASALPFVAQVVVGLLVLQLGMVCPETQPVCDAAKQAHQPILRRTVTRGGWRRRHARTLPARPRGVVSRRLSVRSSARGDCCPKRPIRA